MLVALLSWWCVPLPLWATTVWPPLPPPLLRVPTHTAPQCSDMMLLMQFKLVVPVALAAGLNSSSSVLCVLG